jgi:hypothetical protein
MVVQVPGESPGKHEKKVIFRRMVEAAAQAKKNPAMGGVPCVAGHLCSEA